MLLSLNPFEGILTSLVSTMHGLGKIGKRGILPKMLEYSFNDVTNWSYREHQHRGTLALCSRLMGSCISMVYNTYIIQLKATGVSPAGRAAGSSLFSGSFNRKMQQAARLCGLQQHKASAAAVQATKHILSDRILTELPVPHLGPGTESRGNLALVKQVAVLQQC